MAIRSCRDAEPAPISAVELVVLLTSAALCHDPLTAPVRSGFEGVGADPIHAGEVMRAMFGWGRALVLGVAASMLGAGVQAAPARVFLQQVGAHSAIVKWRGGDADRGRAGGER